MLSKNFLGVRNFQSVKNFLNEICFFQNEKVVESVQRIVRIFFLQIYLFFIGHTSALLYVDFSQKFYCGHQPIFPQRYEVGLSMTAPHASSCVESRKVSARWPHILQIAQNRSKSQQRGLAYFKLRQICLNRA